MEEDDDRRERFDMDNDFEGGEYIDGEFFYRNKRQKRQQTKDEILYGVFADDSDQEADDRRGRKRDKADFSKPVSFISKGEVVNKPDEAMQQEEQEEQRPSFAAMAPRSQQQESGSSMGLGSSGLGFTSAGLGSSAAAAQEGDEVAEGVLPSAFGKR
jgi:tuftelin-interacting protein 11